MKLRSHHSPTPALDMVEHVMKNRRFPDCIKNQLIYMVKEPNKGYSLVLVEGGKLPNSEFPYMEIPEFNGDYDEFKKIFCRKLQNFMWDSRHPSPPSLLLKSENAISDYGKVIYAFAHKAANIIFNARYVPTNLRIYIVESPKGIMIDCARYDVFGKSDYILEFPEFKGSRKYYQRRDQKYHRQRYVMEIAQVIIDALKIG